MFVFIELIIILVLYNVTKNNDDILEFTHNAIEYFCLWWIPVSLVCGFLLGAWNVGLCCFIYWYVQYRDWKRTQDIQSGKIITKVFSKEEAYREKLQKENIDRKRKNAEYQLEYKKKIFEDLENEKIQREEKLRKYR